MEWAALGTIFYNLTFLWIGNVWLTGIILSIISVIIVSRLGLGWDGSILVGGGFLLLFSATMMPWDISGILMIVAGIIIYAMLMRMIRK